MNHRTLSITVCLMTLWCLAATFPVVALADAEHHHDVSEAASDPDHAVHPQDHDTVEQEQEHDHTSHAQGSEISGVSRLGRWLGKFHPVVVHFPIAMLIAAAVAELLKSLLGVAWLSNAARYSVLVGAAVAIVAASLGWLNAAFAGYTGDLAWTLEVHRWLGTTVAVWSIIIAIFSELSVRSSGRKYRGWYLATLVVGAALVGVTGHFGGTLIFGIGYYSW